MPLFDWMAARYIDTMDITASRTPVPRPVRHGVLRRDGLWCRYCGVYANGGFHLDHVYPVSKGGETTIANMVVACPPCNLRKSNRVGVWPKPLGYHYGALRWGLMRWLYRIFIM
jgi:hypothetical protein